MQLSLALQKCSVLHIGPNNPKISLILDNTVVPSVQTQKDLGVWFSDSLKFNKHCMEIAKNASVAANSIFRCFSCRDTKFLIKMFKAYVRPILEYASTVWSPYLLKDIDLIENVQRVFTRRVPGMSNLSYPQRLEALNLDSLELRRLYSDMICTYNIIKNNVDLDFEEFFEFAPLSTTRGNILKLQHKSSSHDFMKYSFALRSVRIWNTLPDNVVGAATVSRFRKALLLCNFSDFIRSRALNTDQLGSACSA